MRGGRRRPEDLHFVRGRWDFTGGIQGPSGLWRRRHFTSVLDCDVDLMWTFSSTLMNEASSEIELLQVFLHFVRDASFPTITDFCPESVGVDAESLQRFKEESCHLDLDQCGMSQKQFVLRRPGEDCAQL